MLGEVDFMSKNQAVFGMFLTLLGGALWGLSGTSAQYLFSHKGISPEWLVSVRLLIAGTLMIAYNLITDKERSLEVFKNKFDTIDVLIYGIVGVALCQYSYFKTISLSNAGTACVLQYFSPVIIIVWVTLAKRVLPRRAELVAVIAAVVGVFLVATGGNLKELSISPGTLFWGLSSAVAVAIYTVQPERILKKFNARILLGWGMLAGALVISPFTRWWEKTPALDLVSLLLIALIILVGTIGSFTLFMEGMKRVGPTKAGLYACIEPVVATLCAALVLSTAFTPIDIVGFALVLLVPFILDFRPKGMKI